MSSNTPPLKMRLRALFDRFDDSPKRESACQLVELLELEESEEALNKIERLLGWTVTGEDRAKLEMLELIARDENYFYGGKDPFFGVGAPKGGL